MMNSTDAPCFFPPCGSYEPPQQWGWRQDVGYPYYAETPLQPLSHPSLPLPPDSSSSGTAAATSGGCSTGGSSGAAGAGCSASSTDCRIGTSQLGSSGSGGGTYPGDSNGRRSVKDEPNEHSNDRDEDLSGPHSSMKQEATSSDCNNGKKKRDRFNGMTEEEVLKKTVPDLLAPNLDVIIIGSCPGLTAAYLGHHYAGPGNHFWKCLYLSGLIPEPMNACDDFKLKQFGIGFTNFIARCSKGSVEFSRREIKEGVECLTEKIQAFKPKIAVFNGKGIYEVFCNHKNFYIGKQPEPFPGTNTVVYVMPSSSARCSQLPRASDKVPFFVALRKLRDHLRGCLPHLDESEIVFPDLDLKVEPRKDRRPAEGDATRPGGGGGNTGGAPGPSGGVSESLSGNSSVASATAAEKDRKRRHVDCNYNDMSSNERLYRSGLPSSFAAMSQEMPQEFKWGAGLQKWPAPPGFSSFAGHPNPLVTAMGGGPGGPSRADCTYEAMLAAKQQEESRAAAFNQCGGLLRSISSGAPFYSGWSDAAAAAAAAQHRWTMHGLANRFGNDTMSSRYGIPPYLQYAPDMDRLSSAGHHLSDSRPPMYPSLYNPSSFQPGEAAAAAAASAFSYNSSLSHDMKTAASGLDPAGFLSRPSYSPPSYYPQYR